MESIWKSTSELPKFNRLNGDINTNVLIIGGGITGILCAYLLKESGVDCVIAEANTICSGMTENTTAKITFQHGLIYRSLIDQFGIEKARMYLNANLKALNKYKSICENIDCDFEIKDSYVYSCGDSSNLEKEAQAVKKLGFNAEIVNKTPLPFDITSALKFKYQGQFNPLKFLSAIIKDMKIYENTKILNVSDNHAFSSHGTINAKKIIFACHFPFIDKYGFYFLKMYQERSYVLALSNATDVDGMYISDNNKGLSLRNYKNILLLGGGAHRTGKKGGGYTFLEDKVKKYFPKAKIEYRFAAQDCITLDQVPYIGQYSKTQPNFYVATGFNKWGMTSSMASAMILTDMITGKTNSEAEVFSPSRSILKPKLAVNAGQAIINLATPTVPRCPHLGCALKWNEEEQTWDCPCHGSRFDKKGHIINNPANRDIKI